MTEDERAIELWAAYILGLIEEQRSDPELGKLIHRAFHGADRCEDECTLKERAEIRELVAYMKNFWLTGLCQGFIPPHAYEAVRERVRILDEAE